MIAGQLDETDLSDGTVPLNSALAVYALLKQRGNEIEEKVVTGENASHSMLHENQSRSACKSIYLERIAIKVSESKCLLTFCKFSMIYM